MIYLWIIYDFFLISTLGWLQFHNPRLPNSWFLPPTQKKLKTPNLRKYDWKTRDLGSSICLKKHIYIYVYIHILCIIAAKSLGQYDISWQNVLQMFSLQIIQAASSSTKQQKRCWNLPFSTFLLEVQLFGEKLVGTLVIRVEHNHYTGCVRGILMMVYEILPT